MSRAVRARPFSSAPDSTSLVGGRATAASRMLLSFSFYYSGGSLAKLLPFIASKEKLLPFFLFFSRHSNFLLKRDNWAFLEERFKWASQFTCLLGHTKESA
jgi:hypothetical protein